MQHPCLLLHWALLAWGSLLGLVPHHHHHPSPAVSQLCESGVSLRTCAPTDFLSLIAMTLEGRYSHSGWAHLAHRAPLQVDFPRSLPSLKALAHALAMTSLPGLTLEASLPRSGSVHREPALV